jgi:SHS2 domain-containing protein
VKRFEYFEHTADTRMRAYGKTFDEALGNLVLAVYNVIVDTSTVQPVELKELVVESQSQESLVYDVITELLFLQDTEGFLGSVVEEVVVEQIPSGWRASIHLMGDTHTDDYDVFGQIKSATYSEMIIHDENGNVFIQAVVDI